MGCWFNKWFSARGVSVSFKLQHLKAQQAHSHSEDRTQVVGGATGVAPSLKYHNTPATPAEMNALTFQDHDDSHNDDLVRVKQLRAQLAVVDRAIGLVGTVDESEYTSGTNHKSGDHTRTGDESFRIDLMSSQLATCPQCMQEMDVKKLKSHTANTCPNKIIMCPELNCGCQLPIRHLRRHLSMECEITSKRRKLVTDAELRKQQAAQRLKDEAEQRRRDRAHTATLVASTNQATVSTVALPPATFSIDNLDGDGGLEARYTTCPKCNESMRQSQLSIHLDKQCSRRRIMCPNYHNGCKQRLVPLFLLQTHLRTECAAEKHRDRMITKAAQRRELMKCPACGELVPLMYLRKHERELCGNRRVHCRNHALGCGVMVRLKDRALHEHVDGNKAIRSALYFPNHGAHLAIGEDDLVCPWTAEYWIYRPPAKESLKSHLRNIALLLPKYNVAFAAEVCVKEQVMKIVRALSISATKNDASAAADAGKMTKEQRAQRARELTAQRMDMVNSLTALVPQYTECVLAYMHAFQELAVSVEAGYLCAVEIISEVGFRDTEKATLAVQYPGAIASRPKSQFSFVAEGAKRNSKGGSKMSSSGTSVSSNGTSTDKEDGQSVGSLHSTRSEAVEAGEDEGIQEPDPDQELLNELLLGDYEEYIDQHGEEGEEEEEDFDIEDADQELADSEVEEERSVHEEQAEEGSVEAENSISVSSNRTGKSGSKANRAAAAAIQSRRPLRVDYSAVATYIMNGSSIASVFKACLHVENESVYFQTEQKIAEFSNVFSTPHDTKVEDDGGVDSEEAALCVPLLHPDLDLAYLVPTTSPLTLSAEEQDAPTPEAPEVHHIPLDRVSKAVLELKAQGVTGFLADMMLAPRRAARAHALSWCSWRSLLEVLRKGLKTDFDALQTWRIEAGLLKPDAVKAGAGGGKADLTAKQEKAMEKKEKARLKREMKKQEKTHNGDVAEATPSASVSATSIATVVGGKKEESLFKRVGELLKAGSGSGVLAESTSTSKDETVHTRICLSLGSGLSILRPNRVESKNDNRPGSPMSVYSSGIAAGSEAGKGSDGENEEEEDDDDHHYDLLLRPQDLNRLSRNSGKFGIVTIPQTVRDLTGMGDAQLQAYAREAEELGEGDGSPSSKSSKLVRRKKASGAATSSSTSVAPKKAGNLVRIGMEARSFEVTVPRGKWTHIALVATALPQNKLTLYMDGLLVKTLKDCAFPLPMSALGGSTQSFESFEGGLLDVRYWGVQRSSLEILDNMHRLLDLEDDAQPADGSESGSRGLIAWWTFEDGGGAVSATDVTGHRFKTLIRRRQNVASSTVSTKKPSTPAVVGDTTRDDAPRASSPSNATRVTSAPGEMKPVNGKSAGDSIVEGIFTAEERQRYRIPEEVKELLHAPYQQLLETKPSTSSTTPGKTAQEDESIRPSSQPALKVEITPSSTGASVNSPWSSWLDTLPRWKWLEAESLPVPKAVVLPASLARHEPPQLPPNKSKNDFSKSRTSHPVPPHRIGAAPTKKHMHAENRSMLPVPSLRARGICPYELRRHRLATAGRELQREGDCPLGCSEKIKMVEVRFHVRFVCQRRLVSCRFDFCHAVFPIEQRSEHEQKECQHMYARNKVLSQAEFHMTLFPCTLCSENILQRDLATHQLKECPHRLVACSYSDCGRGRVPTIQAHLLQYHLRFECDSLTRKERFLLVERARERVKYPRPWGITISLSEQNMSDTNIEQDSIELNNVISSEEVVHIV